MKKKTLVLVLGCVISLGEYALGSSRCAPLEISSGTIAILYREYIISQNIH